MTFSMIDNELGNLVIGSDPAAAATNTQTDASDAQGLAIIGARKEIVFIESDVPDIGTLLSGIGRDKEVVILDSTQDGLHQIAQALAGKSGIDALHIISHGEAGAAHLGSLILDSGNLDAHRNDLLAIRQGMGADGDILLYGCKIGAGGDTGAGFVQKLAIVTGADVAASSDLTGSTALGGNWNLEVTSGTIETPVAVDSQTAALYQQVLGISNATIDFHNQSNFVNTSFDTSQANVDTIYMLNGNINYQLVIDGQDLGTSAYAGSSSFTEYVSAAPKGSDHSVTIKFATGQIFTASSISIANFLNPAWGPYDPYQNLVIKGYDAAGHQVGATSTQSIAYTPNVVTKVPISLTGMAGISSLKITATSNGNLVRYLIIDDLSLTNIQPPPPKVYQVTSPSANGTYKIGQTIDVQINFDGAVDVTGTPQLTLETGTTDRTINYVSGSGTSSLTFRYTVQAGDTSSDLDLLSTAITLNGGTIRAHGNATLDASLTLPSPGGFSSLLANKDIVVDGIAPTLSITSDKTALKAGETATITFTFSEDLGASFTWNGSGGDVVVSGGTLSAISGSGLTRTAVFTPTANTNGGSASISVSAGAYADAAGNINTAASNGPAITYDTKAPTVTVSSSQSTLKAGETATITFTFSEDPGASFDASDITLSGGTLGPISGSGLTRTAVFTPTTNTNNGSAAIAVKSASFQDPGGNSNATGDSTLISYDTKAPTLSISSDKPALMVGETATITFTFSEDASSSFSWDGSSGSITVSGGTLSAIVGTGAIRTAIFTPNANTDAGSASIRVLGGAYHDIAGNDGTASNNLTLSYDTLAPSKPSVPSLAVNDDTGASSSDLITKAESLHLSGTADSGTRIDLYDGATVIASVTASGGTYAFSLENLGDGNHAFVAVAYDAAGNASAASDGLAVTVDRTPPSTTVSGATLSQDTGASSTDMITKEGTQTISGTLSANLAAGEQVMVSLDNGAHWTAATASIGSNTWELASVTLSHSDTLKVQVVDQAGNAGATYTHSYVVDTVAPAAPSTPDLDTASDSGSSHTDNVTSATQPSFSGTTEIGTTVTLYDGASAIGHVTSTDGTWTITSDTPLADGSHDITAIAVDVAGNPGVPSSVLTVHILTAAPATTIDSMALSSDSGTPGDFITNEKTQIISGLLKSNLAAGERVEVSLDQGAHWTAATSAVGDKAWSIGATLTAGTHDIRVRVVDAAENTGLVHTQAYTLDTGAPLVSSVMVPANGTYHAGEEMTFTVHTSEPVLVDPTGGIPQIALVVGSLTRYASYVSGSGSADLQFAYTVQPGDSDSDGITVGSLSTNGGSLTDAAGNNTMLTLNSVGSTALVQVDGIIPRVEGVTATTANGIYRAGDSLTISVAFSEAVTADTSGGTPTLSLTSGGTAVYAGGSGTSTLRFTYTVQPGETTTHLDFSSPTALTLNGGTIRDAAGNNATLTLPAPGATGSLGTDKDIVIDAVAPVLMDSSPVNGASGVAADANLVLTFSEAIVAGTGTIELHAANGALVESFAATSSSRISVTGDTLTIDPTSLLETGTGYYLTVSSDAIKDVVGNSFAGLADSATFHFNTGGAIVTPTEHGGRIITITDPDQLTASLGSSGIDTVFYGGSGTVVLPGTIENITLTGSGNASVIGNGQANVITGNAGNNRLTGDGGNDRLDGGSGHDTMAGGRGNDVYVVDSRGDHIMEGRNAGTETVYSSVSYAIGANVEKLVLTGAASHGTGNSLGNTLRASDTAATLKGMAGNDKLYGGAGRDVLIGGSGNDALYGGLGSDRLTGGLGQDKFVFNTALGRGQVDTIRDFNAFEDTIVLENAVFKTLGRGALDGTAFRWSDKALEADDRILYDVAKGALYYDADGNGSGAAVQFAKVKPWTWLSADDFRII